jgi:DNA-binding NarL/FixJ family response regulator
MTTRVAVIDDDIGFRRIAVLLLRRRGYDVVGEADDIRSALTLIDATNPDAVLLDYHLPDGNGAEFAMQLAQLPRPPRVLLTSSDTEASATPPSGTYFVAKEELASVELQRWL